MWVTWQCVTWQLIWCEWHDDVAWCVSEWRISLWHGVIQSGGSHCLTLAWCVWEWRGLILVWCVLEWRGCTLVWCVWEWRGCTLVWCVLEWRGCTLALCVSGWRDLAVSPWLGVFQGEGISLSHPGLVCFRVKGSHCLTMAGVFQSEGISLSHRGLVCFRVKGSRCLTVAWCVSEWRDLAVSPWLGVFQGEGISLSHPGLVCFRVKGSRCLTLAWRWWWPSRWLSSAAWMWKRFCLRSDAIPTTCTTSDTTDLHCIRPAFPAICCANWVTGCSIHRMYNIGHPLYIWPAHHAVCLMLSKQGDWTPNGIFFICFQHLPLAAVTNQCVLYRDIGNFPWVLLIAFRSFVSLDSNVIRWV